VFFTGGEAVLVQRAGRSLGRGVLAAAVVLAAAGLTLTPATSARAAGAITITNPGDQNNYDGNPVYLRIQATTTDLGATLTYSADALPAGLSLDSSTGVISGSLEGDANEAYVTDVTVSDSAGASATVSFTWQLANTFYDDPVGPMTSAYAGKCLDDRGSGTANGNPVQLYACNGTAAQNVTVGGGGALTVMGKCVQNPGAVNTLGAPLRLWTCISGDNSTGWFLYPNGNVVNATYGCADAPRNTSGTRLVIGACGPGLPSSTGMLWRAPSAALTLALDGKCLDDASPIYYPTGLNKAQMWSCNQSVAQDWSLFPAGLTANGWPVYHVTTTFAGLCLDVNHAGTANGTRVDSYPCNWGAAQLWYFKGTELVNPNSGKCLDDPYSRTANGTQLDIWACNGGRQQSWAAPPTEVAAEIAGTCLTGSSLDPANGSAVSVAPCAASTRAQAWAARTDGTMRVRGKCLDVTGLGTATGTRVQLWSCLSGDVAQQWRWLAGGLLENPHSGKCLAFPGAAPATGSRLVIKPCSATASAGDEWHTL
jgi:hypothetical protein